MQTVIDGEIIEQSIGHTAQCLSLFIFYRHLYSITTAQVTYSITFIIDVTVDEFGPISGEYIEFSAADASPSVETICYQQS